MKALLPLSWIYGAAVWIRNQAFDREYLPSFSAGAPVISVGNMTVGGTGKTPLVEYIARYMIAAGKRVGIVSRGYGRSSRGAVTVSDGRTILIDAMQGGDEPLELARKLRTAVVVVGERRIEAAREAIDRWKANVLILDDGFQHRYIKRDLDIVVVRRPDETFSEPMLPAGRKREPNRSLGRAHLVALSRVEGSSPEIRRTGEFFDGPIIGFRYVINGFDRIDGAESVPSSSVRGNTVHVFSGIGDPDSFEADLASLGLIIRHHTRFDDHHRFTDAELETIVRAASDQRATMIITTGKDSARLTADQRIIAARHSGVGIFSTRLSLAVTSGEQEFHHILERTVTQFHT